MVKRRKTWGITWIKIVTVTLDSLVGKSDWMPCGHMLSGR